MTIENCVKRLEYFKTKLAGNLSSAQRKQMQKNYDNMKAHILKSRKFAEHPILTQLTKSSKEVKKKNEKPKR